MKKLNGWQRIGIVLSVVWIIGDFYIAWTDNAFWDSLPDAPKQSSSSLPKGYVPAPDGLVLDNGYVVHNPPKAPNIFDQFDDPPPSSHKYVLIHAAKNSIPVPITWIVIYSLIWIFRWVRAGFVKR